MPFYRFRLDTPLSPEQAERNITLMTGTRLPIKFFAFSTARKGPRSAAAFSGKVRDGSFDILRNINYRNSFLPTIRGRIEPAVSGAKITVTIFLNPAVAAFCVFWLSMVGWSEWKNIVLQRQAITLSQFVIPILMSTFFLTLTIGGFLTEALIAKRLLKSAFKASGSHS